MILGAKLLHATKGSRASEIVSVKARLELKSDEQNDE
jgi:hypothetical protein